MNNREVMPPHILYLEFAKKSERELGASISGNLKRIQKYRREFASDLALFDFSYENKRDSNGEISDNHISWMSVAARDGAMMLYHFGKTILAFDGLLQKIPNLAKFVDKKTLRTAKEEFENYFSDFNAVRQGVAHLADHSITPERLKKHGTIESSKFITFIAAGNPVPFHIEGYLSDRKWVCTVEGKTVWYELTSASLAELLKIEQIVLSCFNELEKQSHFLRQRRTQKGLALPVD
jgi:hypothetical protein